MRFEYLGPTTVGDALSILAKYDSKAKVIAGGTDLACQMRNVKLDH